MTAEFDEDGERGQRGVWRGGNSGGVLTSFLSGSVGVWQVWKARASVRDVAEQAEEGERLAKERVDRVPIARCRCAGLQGSQRTVWMLFRPPSVPEVRATSPLLSSPRPISSRTTCSLLALVVAVLALIRTTNALPVDALSGDPIPARRARTFLPQDPRSSIGDAFLFRRADAIRRQDTRPFIGAPFGDFYISNDNLECEPLRISFGGGQGPPYALNMVKPPVATNGSVEDVEILERIAVAGMPGMTWWSLDGTSLKAGDAVALQIVDAAGQVGYSVNRHGTHVSLPGIKYRVLTSFSPLSRRSSLERILPVRLSPLAENRSKNSSLIKPYNSYPGALWPPSRWDGNHFVGILLILLGIAFFAVGGVERLKTWWKTRHLRRSVEPTTSDVPLQERRNEGATHVLGDDEERTSLEDEDRPLLRDDEAPGEAPPAYDEVAKEEEDVERADLRIDEREGSRRVG